MNRIHPIRRIRHIFPILTILLLVSSSCIADPVSLFDGRSFTGWEGSLHTVWRIEEASLVAGALDKKQEKNDFIATTTEYGDFDLTLEWKLEGTEGFINGGVQFRSKRIPNHHEMIGYQADLGAGFDGALYDESRRNKVLARPTEEVLAKAQGPHGSWNHYRIRAEGARIRIWLNGVITVDYVESEEGIDRAGLIALQIHGNGNVVVRYRNLCIEKLGES